MSAIQSYTAYFSGKYQTVTPTTLSLNTFQDNEEMNIKHGNIQITDVLDLSSEEISQAYQNSPGKPLSDHLSPEAFERLIQGSKEASYLALEAAGRGSGVQAWIADERAEWENNPLSRWKYHEGSEAYEGHEIMQWLTDFVQVNETSVDGQTRYYGSYPVDEYGYSYNAPATYTTPPGQQPLRPKEPYVWEDVIVHDENPVRSVDTKTANTTLQTQDRVGLAGLTLEERKSFLDGVQQLLDENNINLNARELRYSGGITQPLNVQGQGGNHYNVTDLIRETPDLKELMMKSGRVHANRIANDASAQEYRILVTDSSGNKLPADQIIIEAGDGSRRIQMSVEEFKQLDRSEITSMLP